MNLLLSLLIHIYLSLGFRYLAIQLHDLRVILLEMRRATDLVYILCVIVNLLIRRSSLCLLEHGQELVE